MKIFRAVEIPSQPGDVKTFTGEVVRTTLATDSAGTPVNVYRVEFSPGARTHWHTHDGPQWLFVIEGRIRVQKEGEAGYAKYPRLPVLECAGFELKYGDDPDGPDPRDGASPAP